MPLPPEKGQEALQPLRELGTPLLDLGAEMPFPMFQAVFDDVPMLGGAMSTLAASATAFGDRSALFMLSVDGNWIDPADSADNLAWVREVISQAEERSVAGGTYLNFSGQEESAAAELVRAAYGENLQRLAEVKRRYDPSNLFRLNNNVTPALHKSTVP